MTKKHTHEEYYNGDDISFVLVLSLIITILVVFASLMIYNNFFNPHKTLTQLAEAEGWEVECVGWDKLPTHYSTKPIRDGNWSCFDVSEITITGITEQPLKIIQSIDGSITYACYYEKCTTYALRRHEP